MATRVAVSGSPTSPCPIAQYGPIGTPALCALRGFVKPFPPEQLAGLYTSRDDYLERFDAATRDAVESGFLLEPDAVEARALAAADRISVEEAAAVHAPHLTVHPRAVVRQQVGRDRRDVVGTAGPRRRGLAPMRGDASRLRSPRCGR